MERIFIARHGLTDWNLVPKVQGITDIPLNEGGIKQAYALADYIKNKDISFNKILYSPLKRAAQTAKIVSEVINIPLEVELRLIEQNFGKWEGYANTNPADNSFNFAKQNFFDSYGSGESMARLSQRVYNLLDELKTLNKNENYLLVTHGGIARCINSYFFDMTNEEYAKFQMKNCEIIEYKF